MAGTGAAAASGYMLLRRQPRSLFDAEVKRAMLVTHLLIGEVWVMIIG